VTRRFIHAALVALAFRNETRTPTAEEKKS